MPLKVRVTSHDQHFKKLLVTFFKEFLAAFVPEIASALESRHIEFLDKELVWIRRRFRKAKFVDLVAKVKLKGVAGFILIHVEHQAKRDPAIARRMFLYAAWLIERYGLPIWPVLVTSYSQPRRPEPTRFEISIRGKPIITFNYDVVQLNRLNWRDYLKRPNPAAAALMARMNIASADRARVKAEILHLLLTLRLRPERARLVMDFVETYLELSAREELKLRREVGNFAPDEQERAMRMLMAGERFGIYKGRLEMLREGILDILEARFKQVPYGLREKLQDIQSESRLRKLHRQAALVESLEAFGRKT